MRAWVTRDKGTPRLYNLYFEKPRAEFLDGDGDWIHGDFVAFSAPRARKLGIVAALKGVRYHTPVEVDININKV